jgi:hypothetical protein
MRITKITAAALFAGALSAGAALAQQGEAAAEGEDAEAAEAPPPPPAHLEACGAARCLIVAASPELQQALDAGEATLDQIAEGLTFQYEGQAPVRVYFVAARYNDDRLVRYDVSEAITIDPGMTSIPDVAEVIETALAPRTERDVRAGAIEAAVSVPAPEMPSSAFVGSMPANTLMELVRPDLAEPLTVDQRMGVDEVGVVALVTRDSALRENLESKSFGLALRLNYVK